MASDHTDEEPTPGPPHVRLNLQDLVRRPYAPSAIPAVVFLFLALALLANRMHLFICSRVSGIACIRSWPVSLVFARVPSEIGYPNLSHVLVGAASLFLFALGLLVLRRVRYDPLPAAGFGLALILATTLTHGWQFGLTRATAGMGNMPQDYYLDALRVTNAAEFIESFTDQQPSLEIHSRTHPPGAVLAFHFLHRLLGDPALISIAIAAIASMLTALVLSRLLSAEHDRPTVGRAVLLCLLVPSVQIYYAASLDALLAPLIAGCCVVLFSRSPGWWIASLLCLVLATFFSFGALFVLPVIAAFEVWERRPPWRFLSLTCGLVLVYVVLNSAFGFNYLRSLSIASQLENPDGFRLLAEPADYLMTRAEDIAEVILFFGPFLSIMLVSVLLETGTRSPLDRLAVLSIASFLAVLLTGAYRTGETARAALFMVPFLILPIARRIVAMDPRGSDYNRLASVVFLQALIMQFVADYWW